VTEIVLFRRAREDFKRIWSYIASDSPAAADRTLMAIDAKIERLRSFPESGNARDDIRPNARMIVHGSYLVLYEYDLTTKTVEIVTVVEDMRDLKQLL